MQLIRPISITQANLTSNIAIDDAPEYNVAVTYALGDKVIDTTSVDATYHVYESLIAANLGHALTDQSIWLDLGSINRLAMFDQVVGTTTDAASLIDVSIDATTVANGLALFNLNAAQVEVTVTNASGTLYDETFSLRSTFGITDWYSWFTQEVQFATDFALTNLPPYSGTTIRVQISNATEEVSCGTMVLGKLRDLGSGPEYGARGGIIDYSRKEADQFGNLTLVERAFAKRWNFTMLVPAGDVDGIFNVLSSYRATPVAWIGSESYASTLIFGWARDWNEEISYPSFSLLSLEVEGLV
jgi:hypothetical protein